MSAGKDELVHADFGVAATGPCGFPSVVFEDSYSEKCRLSCSSVIGDYEDSMNRPGTSAVWLGLREVAARVMARDAAKVGVATDRTTGWVAYPIPNEVLVSVDMHLDRGQVAGLIDRLQQWLETGTFHGAETNAPG